MPPLLIKILKVGVGIFFIPLAFLAGRLWPWWEKQNLPMKIISGVFVLPITAIVFSISFWYNDL